MPCDDKKAAIEAEYRPVIRELLAKKDPLANLAAVLLAGKMASALGNRAKAEAIEKVTPPPPITRPETTIENMTSAAKKDVANG